MPPGCALFSEGCRGVLRLHWNEINVKSWYIYLWVWQSYEPLLALWQSFTIVEFCHGISLKTLGKQWEKNYIWPFYLVKCLMWD